MAESKKLVIIDAHALIHRAYHALPPMATEGGLPTNAVYGFATMLLKAMKHLRPSHVAVAFDMHGPTFRHEEYVGYKAHRKPAPDDLIAQFDMTRELVQAFSIPIFEQQGYEADDIIATIVRIVDGQMPIVIVTGDMDALQLVTPTTSVFTMKRGISDTVLYTPEMVVEKYGFSPDHIPDYKGLAGDPSDNIPGVPGIGVKTAKDLVSAYGSLEFIFSHMDNLSPRATRSLKGHEEEAFFSRKLATMDRNVPIHFSLDNVVFRAYDMARVREAFQKLEFRTLLRTLQTGDNVEQPTLFAGGVADNIRASLPRGYHIAKTIREQKDLIDILSNAKLISFDTETDGLGGRTSPLVGMSFAIHSKDDAIKAWYVPVDTRGVLVWKDFLENPAIAKTGHNLKYDMEVLMQSGIHLRGIVFDSMIASYLLRSGSRAHGLDDLAREKLQYNPIPITDLIGTGKTQKSMKDVPLLDIARYACEDADVALRLHDVFSPEIAKEKLSAVLKDIELPLIDVLAHMELAGVSIDVRVLASMGKKIVQRISEIEQQIWAMAGRTFNIGSPKQLRVILFEELKLPTIGIKKNQTGYSTSAEVLEKLRDAHPIIGLLSEFREIMKLKSTYIDTLPNLVDPKTGRIYSSINQTVAATGRLSSSDPNLQNIPIRTDLGREIRKAFIARDGYVFVKADYSQLELRIAAHMAHDEKLVEAFRAGEDIHRSTASWVFDVPMEKVTDDMRRQAKTLNFGVLYGMGPQSFSQAAGVSMEEARSFIDRYKHQYAGIESFIAETVTRARSQGYVETMFGRRRYIPEVHSSNSAIRASAERIAFNFPIQGTEADMLKKAMVSLYSLMQEKYKHSSLVLTVHDELVCEVPTEDAQVFAREMKEIMEGVMFLDVPLVVDVGIGPNWGTIESV